MKNNTTNNIKYTNDVFSGIVNKKFLLDKFEEFKSVLGDGGFEGIMLIRDAMIATGDTGVYVTQSPLDLPIGWFMPYRQFLWIEDQDCENFMITSDYFDVYFNPID